MLPERVSKKIAALSTASRKGVRCKDLFRLMGHPELWMAAYANIYSNKGAITKGVDQNTLDGFSDERVLDLITRLKEKTYRHAPVRRVYIPKANGKKRPLGISTGDDKLVQEVCRILLEAIYEPVFLPESHGFRKGRSCHTALKDIQRTWHGTKWFLSMDIKGFFDHVSHDRLVRAIEERVDDKRFLALIRQMLKAGVMEEFKFHETYSGTPQGGIVSPLLANIYLHELDQFIVRQCRPNFEKGKKRAEHREYANLSHHIYRHRQRISKIMDESGPHDPRVAEIKQKIKEIKRVRQTLPSRDPMDAGYRRLHYCRYADDFLLGVIGTKDETRHIEAAVRHFLKENLDLEVATNKTQLNHRSEGIQYLSYDITCENRDRIVRVKRGKYTASVRSIRGQIILDIPREKIKSFCLDHGYGNYDQHRWSHVPYLLNRSDLEILMVFNAQLRGFANYYGLVNNVKTRLHKLRYIWLGSLLSTLANKYKSSYGKMYQHYRAKGWIISYPTKKGMKATKFFNMDQITDPNDRVHLKPNIYTITRSRSDIVDRFNFEQCEYCGKDSGYFEVHHVKKLSNLKGKTEWERLMIGMQRKTMVLCVQCHDQLHAGTLHSVRK